MGDYPSHEEQRLTGKPRGQMHYVNAIISFVLVLAAVVHFDRPAESAMFVLGAVLAAIALKHWLHARMVGLLAVITTGAMFFFFASFFRLTPTLQPDWYWQGQQAVHVASLLFAGFAMIPVLTEFSCRMKASEDCPLTRRAEVAKVAKEQKSSVASVRS